MALELTKEVRGRLCASIQRFLREELDQEVGQLKAVLLLDFCLKEIGPSIYNHAIADAQAVLHERVTELDASCYEPEFGYWARERKPEA